MAAFGSKLSAASCKYLSTTVCDSRSPTNFLPLSASHYSPVHGSSSLLRWRPQASKAARTTAPTERAPVVSDTERTTGRKGSGFSPPRPGEGVGSLVVDRDVQDVAGRSHEQKSRGVRFRNDMDVHSYGPSPLSSGDGRVERKSRKSLSSGVGWVERKSRKSKDSAMVDTASGKKVEEMVPLVGKKGKDKMSKKAKLDSAEVALRIGLDMCSKRGDFMGAISLYDSAVREGVKLDQYHYNVVLYLCASAAGGVVQPAKSGSNSYSSSGAGFKDANTNRVISDVVDIVQLNGDKSTLEGPNGLLTGSARNPVVNGSSDPMGSSCDKKGPSLRDNLVDDPNSSCDMKTTFDLPVETTAERETENGQILSSQNNVAAGDVSAIKTAEHRNRDHCVIQVTEDMRKYTLTKGFEIYKRMCLEGIPLSEAALTSVGRMAMSMGDGDMAFEIVKKIKDMGLTLRLRSYGPALFTYCTSGNTEKAFEVERHMIESGIHPEEPELQALLRLSIGAGRGEKVYYILHKLRTSVRQVSPATAELIETWFKSSPASRVGKRKWDQKLIEQAIENGGGGWHGLGWLGKGKWNVVHAHVDANGICESCGEKLVTIDLDPIETENFARSVASTAGKRERSSSFQKFQKWLDYYGPFEAVIDAANVGLFSQRRFSLAKVNAVVNGIRQKLPSKKWPLVIVHNKRVFGGKMNNPTNIKLVEKWKNADAIYATPTGSNDDWYWLYAAINCKSLIVTNDEMRDHIFQILGNDFFPKWKERHQVHFNFVDGSPQFLMPPPCSIVIQESNKGHWHIPIAVEHESDKGRIWLCITRAGTVKETSPEVKTQNTGTDGHASRPLASHLGIGIHMNAQDHTQKILKSPHKCLPADGVKKRTIVFNLETAEKLCGCVIDFQI